MSLVHGDGGTRETHPRGHALFRVLSAAAALWTYVTIVLGANVMATNSGLSCPDWPLCTPSSLGPPVFAGAAALEFTHRLAAAALSLLILALLLVALYAEQRRPALLRISILAVGMVVVQAILGGIIIFTRESNVVVVTHLALATALFGLLLLLAFLANLPYLPRGWYARAFGEEELRHYIQVSGVREPAPPPPRPGAPREDVPAPSPGPP
jgi:heme A synthase